MIPLLSSARLRLSFPLALSYTAFTVTVFVVLSRVTPFPSFPSSFSVYVKLFFSSPPISVRLIWIALSANLMFPFSSFLASATFLSPSYRPKVNSLSFRARPSSTFFASSPIFASISYFLLLVNVAVSTFALSPATTVTSISLFPDKVTL